MQSGGSVSPSVVRRVDRPARRSAPRKGATPATAVVAAVEDTPPAVVTTRPVVAGTPPAAVGTPLAVAGGDTPAARARCTRQPVPSVAGTRKFPSSLARTSRSTAGSASSCGGQQRLRATTTTRTRSSPEGGGQPVAPFSIVCSPVSSRMRVRGRWPVPGVLAWWALVCIPFRSTRTPLTQTSRTPVDSWCGLVYVAWSSLLSSWSPEC